MRKYEAAILVLLAGFSGSGCSSGSDEIVRTGEQRPKAGADGRLLSDPAPLTIRDVRDQKRGSPEATVFELWFWSQWGNVPRVVQMYDPAVVRAVGVSRIGGSYSQNRAGMLASQIRVITSRASAGGHFVGLEILSKAQAPQRESYLLRRQGGEWKVSYDTPFERYVNGYVQYRALRDPGAKKPDGNALRAGDKASAEYRDIYASDIVGG